MRSLSPFYPPTRPENLRLMVISLVPGFNDKPSPHCVISHFAKQAPRKDATNRRQGRARQSFSPIISLTTGDSGIVDWESFKIDRFAKLMAMAFSKQENESLSALRLAARMLDEAAAVPGTKGLMLCFDDFLEGLEQFGKRVQPLMRSRAAVTGNADRNIPPIR